MSKTTLKLNNKDIALHDVSGKVYTGIEAVMQRLNRFRTGTVIDIVTASAPNIVFDVNKMYYMLFDEVLNTVKIIYVNLTTHVVHVIAQADTSDDWNRMPKKFCERLCMLVGSLHILHSNDRRAYTVMHVAGTQDVTYRIAESGTIELRGPRVIIENSYRNLKGKVVTERYLDVATAVQYAMLRKQETQDERYAVVAPKGAVVFFI